VTTKLRGLGSFAVAFQSISLSWNLYRRKRGEAEAGGAAGDMICDRVLDVFSSAMGFKPSRGYIDFKKNSVWFRAASGVC
jgi:hypothetical protein